MHTLVIYIALLVKSLHGIIAVMQQHQCSLTALLKSHHQMQIYKIQGVRRSSTRHTERRDTFIECHWHVQQYAVHCTCALRYMTFCDELALLCETLSCQSTDLSEVAP